jgi:hypothetical protein
MFTNILRAPETTVALHEAQAAFRSKHALTNNLSWNGQEAGKAGKTLYTFFWTCAKPMTLCGGMASSTSSSRKGRRQALASPAGYVRKDEFTSAVNDQLSDAFPLRSWTRDPHDAAFDIYIDVDCLHECATEDAVALGER